MIELKKTTKFDSKMKGLHFEGSDLIDENGEIIDIAKHLKAAYGDKYFDLSTTSKVEEIEEIEVEDIEDEE